MGDSPALALEDYHAAKPRTAAKAEERANDHSKGDARRGAASPDGVSIPDAIALLQQPGAARAILPATIQRPGRPAIFAGCVLRAVAVQHSRRGPACFAGPGATGTAQARPHAGSVEVGGDLSSKRLLGGRQPAFLRAARRQRDVHRPQEY